MDTRNGTIYDSREAAELAGVLDADLVTGSREALEKLRKKLVFTKGSFKPAQQEKAHMEDRDESTSGLGTSPQADGDSSPSEPKGEPTETAEAPKAAVMFSKATDEWETPQAFYRELDAEFSFDVDVAASPYNRKCGFYFTAADNALGRSWSKPGNLEWINPVTCWMNPPYSRCREFIAKAKAESLKGCTVVCLVPARTDTRWWHEYVYFGDGLYWPGVEVRFIKGRLKFGNSTNSAPFPSVVVIFRPVTV